MKKIIAVVGPTASGKSDLAVELALKFNGEIVSADSRQVYTGLDIGTGKVTKEEMRGVPHCLLDVADVSTVFTVSDYERMALEAIDYILTRGRLPILCGGTGFYVNSVLYENAFARVLPDEKIRKQLSGMTPAEMADKLKEIDIERYNSIDVHNPMRLIRALEIVLSTGKPVSQNIKMSRFEALKIGIFWEREELSRRIELRLDTRLKSGMIEEIEGLLDKGVSHERLYDLGLEYRYISQYIKGDLSYDKMREKLLSEIRKYAKRQMTWFRREKDIVWIKAGELDKASDLVEGFLSDKDHLKKD